VIAPSVDKIKGNQRLPQAFVIPARFERATHSLEGCCSIQLSYGTLYPIKDPRRKTKDIKAAKLNAELFQGVQK
jgi:hypothetical protein